MSKIPVINAKRFENLLFKLGFVKTRQKGSHAFYRHEDGRSTVLPHHSKRDIARPLIRQILREIEITPDEYESLLK